MDEIIHTTRDADLRGAMCRCRTCGYTARCTPNDDFYGEDGEPLECERCVMKGMGAVDLIHMVPVLNCAEVPPRREMQAVSPAVFAEVAGRRRG